MKIPHLLVNNNKSQQTEICTDDGYNSCQRKGHSQRVVLQPYGTLGTKRIYEGKVREWMGWGEGGTQPRDGLERGTVKGWLWWEESDIVGLT